MRHLSRSGSVLAIFALAIWLYPPMTATPRLLHRFYGQLASQWSNVAGEWRMEHGGERVLPPAARAIIGLLREHGVREFRYSDAIARHPDMSLPQRLAEGAYPIVIRADARHLVASATEPAIPPGCRQLGIREGVVLVRCA